MFGITIGLIVLGVVGVFGLTLMLFIFTRMFPTVVKMTDYKTGGFLREHVNIGTLVLLILYFVFLYLPNIVIALLSPLLFILPIIWILLISFFIQVGFLILLWQITVPFGLKLPYGKESFRQHCFSIGLIRVKPLWRNIVIGIGSFTLLGFSGLLIGELLGNYIFNPEILITGYNWFIFFIFMLIPGIWEEIAFRGVILNLQLQKYSKNTVVFLNGLLFGLFHFVNILFGQAFGPTLIQVIYASCIGIAFAYMYIKTNSLLPSIILHYLFDAVGVIFQTFIFQNFIDEVIFVIFGLGVVPMILIILFVKLIVRDKFNFKRNSNFV
jgi:membrane protease YdiL (CAAX protease family)